LGHSKQKILQKIGNSEKSVDEDYSTLKTQYKAMAKLIKSIDGELKKQSKSETFNVSFELLGTSIGKFYEDDPQESHKAAEFTNAIASIKAAIVEYNEYQKQISTLVQEYLGKLLAIKPKITERENLHLDYDKWRNQVKTYQEKPPKEAEKMEQAEKKYENYKELFESSNNDVIQTLSSFYENRYQDFDGAYSLLVTSQYKLFTRILIAFQELRSKGSSNPMSPMSLQSYQSNSSNQSSSNQPTATTKSLPNPWANQSTPQTQEESPKTAKKLPDPKVSLLLNKSKAKKAKAIYEYEANEDNELSFKEDDIITIIEEVPDSQWWKGECKGSIGLFPNNYVEIIAEVDNSSEKQRKEAEDLRKQQEEAEKKRLEEISRKKKQEEEFKKETRRRQKEKRRN